MIIACCTSRKRVAECSVYQVAVFYESSVCKGPNGIFAIVTRKNLISFRISVRHAIGLNLSKCSTPLFVLKQNRCRVCEAFVTVKVIATFIHDFCERSSLFRDRASVISAVFSLISTW